MTSRKWQARGSGLAEIRRRFERDALAKHARVIDESHVVARAVEVAGRAWTEMDFREDLETARRMLPDLLLR